MSVPTYQESYETYPKPTEGERERARELIKIALTELETELPMTPEETIKEFEELRQDIIKQCQINGTL